MPNKQNAFSKVFYFLKEEVIIILGGVNYFDILIPTKPAPQQKPVQAKEF